MPMSSANAAPKHRAACLAGRGLPGRQRARAGRLRHRARPELTSPARVVPVAGSSIPRLELTRGAVQRLGIQTRPVAAAAPGTAGASEVIPYAAVVYDTDGSSWTYVETAADTYVRQPITVTVIRGNAALLSAGPPVGAPVVTVGVGGAAGHRVRHQRRRMSPAGPQRTLMRSIIGSSLRFRYLVVAAAVGIMLLGITSLPRMHVDVFPEFAPPRVLIQTACVGLSTSDVEQLVTVPLEAALNGIQGLDDMRSKSVPQLSSIELLFKPGTDQLRARQLVQERIATVSPSLPTWAAPPVMLAPVSATGRAMQIGMTSKSHSLIEMSMTAYWTIRARLLRVPGVANVAIWNERLQLMAVQAEPSKMAAKDVSLDQVMEATSDAVDSGLLKFSTGAVIGTGGSIETPNQRIGIRNVLPDRHAGRPGQGAGQPATGPGRCASATSRPSPRRTSR